MTLLFAAGCPKIASSSFGRRIGLRPPHWAPALADDISQFLMMAASTLGASVACDGPGNDCCVRWCVRRDRSVPSRLDDVIERLRALPEAEQDMVAGEIEGLLAEPDSLLTPAQWSEVEQEIDTDDGVRLSHSAVMTSMRARFGR